MAISPRDLARFYAGSIPSPHRRRSVSGQPDAHELAFPKMANFSQFDASRFQDANLTMLFQTWLLNNLRSFNALFPSAGSQNLFSFPSLSAVSRQHKHDFILNDLHQKYKKFFSEHEYSLKDKSFARHPVINDINSTNTKLFPIPQLLPPFPYFHNQSHLCLSSPPTQTLHPSPFPGPFPTLPSQKLSPKLETIPPTTVHHQGSFLKEEANSPGKSLATDALKDKKTHKCMYCGKLYSRKYGLKIHIRTHTGYKPLKCKVCGRPFGDPSNLNKHVRLHAEGDTPYRCEFCGKVLVRRRDLERHIKSRHPSVVEKIEMFSDSWKITT